MRCGSVHAIALGVKIDDQVYGYGGTAELRRRGVTRLLVAMRAIVALDTRVNGHPLQRIWARGEQQYALADAAGEGGYPGDAPGIFRARLGVSSLGEGFLNLGDVDRRARRWGQVAQRRGPAELRQLVAAITPAGRQPDLVALAAGLEAAVPDCAQSSFEIDRLGDGGPTVTVASAPDDAVDIGDLLHAVPYALRRMTAVRSVLPGLSGRVRVLATDRSDRLEVWANSLADQAARGEAHLEMLERFAVKVERQLGSSRRSSSVRRLVGAALGSWGVWASQLAQQLDVDGSTAWRALGQAEELGLVQVVPGQPRSRGDGRIHAAAPWLRHAGLLVAPRGRPRAVPLGPTSDLGGILDEVDRAIAAADALADRGSSISHAEA